MIEKPAKLHPDCETEGCQYGKDVGMTEYGCRRKCLYLIERTDPPKEKGGKRIACPHCGRLIELS